MPGFVYSLTMVPLKSFCSTLAGVKECLDIEKDAQGKSDQAKPKHRLNKKLSTIEEEAGDDQDEPKTYEVFDDGNDNKNDG